MTQAQQIRTRADGSINTAFYMARGRVMRSQAAHRATREGGQGARRVVVALALVSLVAVPVIGAIG